MKMIQYARFLLTLVAPMCLANPALAQSSDSNSGVLIGTTWEVHQCVAFSSAMACTADSNHPIDRDLIKVSRLFDNVALVSYVSDRDREAHNFGGHIVGSGTKPVNIEGKWLQVDYLQAEFLDTAGGLPIEKRLDLHLVHDDERGAKACTELLMEVSDDMLEPDTSRKARLTECSSNGQYHVHWSICTLDRQTNTCLREASNGGFTILSPPDDSQGTGSGGDTGGLGGP